jgi:hypothetical protein
MRDDVKFSDNSFLRARNESGNVLLWRKRFLRIWEDGHL